MLRRLPEAAWRFRGTVNEHPTTARAMDYAFAGHAEHHLRIIATRLRGTGEYGACLEPRTWNAPRFIAGYVLFFARRPRFFKNSHNLRRRHIGGH